jgi:hypothetical protein
MSKTNCASCRSADDEINERHVCPHCNGFAYFLRFPRDLRLQVIDELYNDPEDLEFLKTLNLPEDIPTMEKCLNALGNQTPYTTVQRALTWRLIELRKEQEQEKVVCNAAFKKERDLIIKGAQELLDHATKRREELEMRRAEIEASIAEVKSQQEKYMHVMDRAISVYEDVERILPVKF